jgi:hypothetical protein
MCEQAADHTAAGAATAADLLAVGLMRSAGARWQRTWLSAVLYATLGSCQQSEQQRWTVQQRAGSFTRTAICYFLLCVSSQHKPNFAYRRAWNSAARACLLCYVPRSGSVVLVNASARTITPDTVLASACKLPLPSCALLHYCRRRIVKHAEDHYTVSFKSPDGPEQTLEVGLVMMATGRSPRTAGLGLEVSRMQ